MLKGQSRKILAILGSVLLMLILCTSTGIAYAGGVRGVGLVGICFFLTCGILVVLAQMIPAGILLFCYLGRTFPFSRKTEAPIGAI